LLYSTLSNIEKEVAIIDTQLKPKPTKTRKGLKITLIAILALLVVITAGVLFTWNMYGRPSLHSANIAHVRTMDFTSVSFYPPSFATDALYLVRLVEQAHPTFIVDGWLPDHYEAARDEFLAYAQYENLTRLDFAFAVARFITLLRDGHMSGQGVLIGQDEYGVWGLEIFGDLLDVRWSEINNNLHLRNEDGELTASIVTEIGGAPTAYVFAVIDRYFYAENDAERQHNYVILSRFGDIIERAGGTISGNEVILTLYTNGTISHETATLEPPEPWHGDDYIIRYEIKDDIFFIDLRVFIDGPHIDQTVRAIEQAIENGIQKFIVDLRGNGGGASIAGQRLLEAMGITVPRFGSIRRISPHLISHTGMFPLHVLRWFGIDYARIEAYVPENNNPNNVFVSVLTNSSSYSSATMMGVWVQDGGFGNIVGSASKNAPTAFGDILGFTLPYSGFVGSVSHVLWFRPDANADPSVLLPDIIVEPGYALEAALEYLRNMG